MPEELPARRGVHGSLQILVHHQGAAAVATKHILFSTFWARAATQICASQCRLNVFQRDLDQVCFESCLGKGYTADECNGHCNYKVTTGAGKWWGGVFLVKRGVPSWKGSSVLPSNQVFSIKLAGPHLWNISERISANKRFSSRIWARAVIQICTSQCK